MWRILHDHTSTVPGFSPEVITAIEAFFECGELLAGFTRLHCPDCGHEFLGPFSCKVFRAAQTWGVDPLRCPLCSGVLRPIAVVETKAEIETILAPLGSRLPGHELIVRPHELPFAHGPLPPEVNGQFDAATGDCHLLGPPDYPPGCCIRIIGTKRSGSVPR